MGQKCICTKFLIRLSQKIIKSEKNLKEKSNANEKGRWLHISIDFLHGVNEIVQGKKKVLQRKLSIQQFYFLALGNIAWMCAFKMTGKKWNSGDWKLLSRECFRPHDLDVLIEYAEKTITHLNSIRTIFLTSLYVAFSSLVGNMS